MMAFGRYDCNLLLFGDFSRLIWLVLFLEIRLSEFGFWLLLEWTLNGFGNFGFFYGEEILVTIISW